MLLSISTLAGKFVIYLACLISRQSKNNKFCEVVLDNYLLKYSCKIVVFMCVHRHSTIREIAVMVLMAYVSYMLAEVIEKQSKYILLNFTCHLTVHMFFPFIFHVRSKEMK